MAVLELGNVIRAWESSLLNDKFLMGPSTVVIVESTIEHLKELKDIKSQNLPANNKQDEAGKIITENSLSGI